MHIVKQQAHNASFNLLNDHFCFWQTGPEARFSWHSNRRTL